MLACVALGVSAGTAAAQASPAGADRGGHGEVVVTHQTFRLGDGDNDMVVFVNKSRADLCTPERIVFEKALVAWWDGGEVGEPPVEPADSRVGSAKVVRTTIEHNQRTETTFVGDDLPVEVWRADDEGGGIDCIATDGPGGERFATGRLDYRATFVESPSAFRSDIRLGGVVRDEQSARWNYSIRYITKVDNGELTSFTSQIKLVPKH